MSESVEIPFAELPETMMRIAESIEFAGILTMTRTAFKCREAAQQSLSDRFTLRNKFELNSIRYDGATKSKDYAEVYTDQKVLKDQEFGAVRDDGTDFKIPTAVYEITGADQKKVIQKNLRAAAIQKKKFGGAKPFIATIGEIHGVWIRTDEGTRLLYDLKKTITIKAKPWFYEPVQKAYDDNLQSIYDKTYDEELDKLWLELV